MTGSNKIRELFDNGRHELINGDYDKSIDFLSQTLAGDPNHKLALISRGSAFLKIDRFTDAVNDFDRAIEIDSGYARAYHLRGVAKEKNGDNEGALEDFSSAISIEPEYGAAYFSRATLLTKMKKEDLAVEDIQMVQHLTNKNIETFANDNNVWRSQQLRLESMIESELVR